MYENLEDVITHKRFVPTPRPFPSVKLIDHYEVQPWQKNTLEVEIRDGSASRQVKTFYHTPAIKRHHKNYATQRGFSFWNNQPSKTLPKPKSLAEVSRKSMVNPYNISGNILGEGHASQQSLPFQLPAKRTKSFRTRQKSHQNDEKDPLPSRETVSAMKRRIQQKKQQQGSKGYIRLNIQND